MKLGRERERDKLEAQRIN